MAVRHATTMKESFRKAGIKPAAERLGDVCADILKRCGGNFELAKQAAPFVAMTVAARTPSEAERKECEKQMRNLARELPVWPWCEEIRGFAELGVALIVAETGDLSNYDNPAKVWKRMGLAVMSGVRQGGLAKSAAAEDWIAHGYNSTRRATMWTIGDALLKNNKGEFRKVYDERKAFERAKAEAAGLIVAPSAKIPAKRKAEYISDGHIHKKAQRYMEKRLLRNLWRAWRAAATESMKPSVVVPPPVSLAAD